MLILPYKTDRPRIRPAYLTITLIVINVLVQVIQWNTPEVQVQVGRGAEAEMIPMPMVIASYGLWGSHPTLEAMFTHMFVHGGLLHLAGNMLFLWIFGSLIEDVLRPWGLAALYFGGGLMAAATHVFVSAAVGHDLNVPLVGASGSVAAVMGLFMLRFHRTKVRIVMGFLLIFWWRFWVRAVWALAYWIGLEVIDGVLSNMDTEGSGTAHWAHIGGFAAGAIVAPFIGGLTQAQKEYITDDPQTNVEYVRRGEIVSAEEKTLAADPTNAYQMRRLARAYREAGEYEDATATYLRSIHRFASRNMLEQAAEVYLELMEHNDAAEIPPEVLLKLAQHLEEHHLAMAVWTYQALTVRHPTRPEAELALLRLAVLYKETLLQPEQAARCLQEFFHRYPQSEWIPQAQSLWYHLSSPQTSA